jgi:hypothetical protein
MYLGMEIILGVHPMVLLGNNGQEEARFGPFGDSVNLGVRYVHGLCRMYYRHENHFGHTQWHS